MTPLADPLVAAVVGPDRERVVARVAVVEADRQRHAGDVGLDPVRLREAERLPAHYRLAVTPMYFEDGTGNEEWMAAHGAFHAALTAAAGSPILERLRRRLYDASELHRYWVGNLPRHPTRGTSGRRRRHRLKVPPLAYAVSIPNGSGVRDIANSGVMPSVCQLGRRSCNRSRSSTA